MQEVSERDYGKLEGAVSGLTEWKKEHMEHHTRFEEQVGRYMRQQNVYQGGIALLLIILNLVWPLIASHWTKPNP